MLFSALWHMVSALVITPALFTIDKFPNRGGNKRVKILSNLLFWLLINSCIQAVQKTAIVSGIFEADSRDRPREEPVSAKQMPPPSPLLTSPNGSLWLEGGDKMGPNRTLVERTILPPATLSLGGSVAIGDQPSVTFATIGAGSSSRSPIESVISSADVSSLGSPPVSADWTPASLSGEAAIRRERPSLEQSARALDGQQVARSTRLVRHTVGRQWRPISMPLAGPRDQQAGGQDNLAPPSSGTNGAPERARQAQEWPPKWPTLLAHPPNTLQEALKSLSLPPGEGQESRQKQPLVSSSSAHLGHGNGSAGRRRQHSGQPLEKSESMDSAGTTQSSGLGGAGLADGTSKGWPTQTGAKCRREANNLVSQQTSDSQTAARQPLGSTTTTSTSTRRRRRSALIAFCCWSLVVASRLVSTARVLSLVASTFWSQTRIT